jgi:predicted RNA-binding Zn ribbon-like protein
VALHTEPALDGTLALVERTAAPNLLARLQGTIARSAIGLLTGPQRALLHVCEAPSCGMLFVGDRRWCCTACGNRARAARHYRRTRARA